ncbi:mukB [Acrasis kona]|uniref:MukB n=1 Tax=Acrasis kona TaxID=1008807 RepID=A0AAW2YHY6_9EUKA
MDRFIFLDTLEWACAISTQQKATLLEKGDYKKVHGGLGCLQSNFSAPNKEKQILFFKADEGGDYAQFTLEMYIVQLIHKDDREKDIREPKPKKRKTQLDNDSTCSLLLCSFDERWYLFDHNQIQRIVTPSTEVFEEEIPFACIQFNNISLRLYFNHNNQTKTKSEQAKLLIATINDLLTKLKPMENINAVIQSRLPKQDEQVTSSPGEDLLAIKHASWINFLNSLDTYFLSNLNKDSDGYNQLLNKYSDSTLNKSSTSLITKINTKYNSSEKDFSSQWDLYEEEMEKKVIEQVEAIFSFSQTQRVPSEASLELLQEEINKLNVISRKGLVISSLIQKHFHD